MASSAYDNYVQETFHENKSRIAKSKEDYKCSKSVKDRNKKQRKTAMIKNQSG